MTSSSCSMPREEPKPSSTTGCFTDASKQGYPRSKIPIPPIGSLSEFQSSRRASLEFDRRRHRMRATKSLLPNQYLRSRVRLRRVCVCGRKPSMKPTFGPVGCDTGAGGGTGRRAGFRCRCLRTCGFESHPAHHAPSTGYPLSHSIPRQTSHSPMWRVTETRHLQRLRR